MVTSLGLLILLPSLVTSLAPAVSRRAAVGGAVATVATGVNAEEIRSTKGGVKYRVVKEGSCPTADPTGLAGSCRPVEGSFCIIDYTGFLPSGAVFDSTESKGRKPLAFRLGEMQVHAFFLKKNNPARR